MKYLRSGTILVTMKMCKVISMLDLCQRALFLFNDLTEMRLKLQTSFDENEPIR